MKVRNKRGASPVLARCYLVLFVFSWYSLGILLVFFHFFPGSARAPLGTPNGFAAAALSAFDRAATAAFRLD